jgi:hypothetical protein
MDRPREALGRGLGWSLARGQRGILQLVLLCEMGAADPVPRTQGPGTFPAMLGLWPSLPPPQLLVGKAGAFLDSQPSCWLGVAIFRLGQNGVPQVHTLSLSLLRTLTLTMR